MPHALSDAYRVPDVISTRRFSAPARRRKSTKFAAPQVGDTL